MLTQKINETFVGENITINSDHSFKNCFFRSGTRIRIIGGVVAFENCQWLHTDRGIIVQPMQSSVSLIVLNCVFDSLRMWRGSDGEAIVVEGSWNPVGHMHLSHIGSYKNGNTFIIQGANVMRGLLEKVDINDSAGIVLERKYKDPNTSVHDFKIDKINMDNYRTKHRQKEQGLRMPYPPIYLDSTTHNCNVTNVRIGRRVKLQQSMKNPLTVNIKAETLVTEDPGPYYVDGTNGSSISKVELV